MTVINIPGLKDCDDWRHNPNINPLSRRKIASGKRVYKLLDKECTRLEKRRSYRQSKGSPVSGKISPQTQSPITSMDKALAQAISQQESIATACRADEKFDALTSRCVLRAAQGVPEEIRKIDTGMEKAETALEIIQGTAEPGLQVFGRQVEEPLRGRQAPSETREVLAEVAETFESVADQLEKLKRDCRSQGMAYSQSLEKCVAPPTAKGETKVERLRRLAAECRQKGLRYNSTLNQCVALKKAAAKVETAVEELVETYVERPDYFELMMEDDCEGYEYPSADFSKCYKFSGVKSTACPSDEIFHYREMKCQPKSQAWSRGEHDIKVKYDNWLQNEGRFGAAAPKEEAPKFKNIYEALAARAESYPDKMKRLATECRKEGKKYNAKLDKCVELSKSGSEGEIFLGIGKLTMKVKDMGFDMLLQKHKTATTKEERAKWKNMLNAKCKELQGRRDSYYNFREDECEHK